MIGSFTKPEALGAEIEKLRFAADRPEALGREVVVFESYVWDDYPEDMREGQRRNFEETLRLLGIDTAADDRVRDASYTFEGMSHHRDPVVLPRNGGTVQVKEALYDIAMAYAVHADEPNDFMVQLRIALTDSLDALVEYRSEECGLVCKDCSFGDVSGGESCEHHEDEYGYRTEYRVALERTDS